jgi:type II secretory pathway pseudopilin PulG
MRRMSGMMTLRQKVTGFTLLEMLLVMAIATTILIAVMGYATHKNDELMRDRTVMQIEQILNGGLAYYINYSAWPTSSDLSTLQTAHYLPAGTILNPWGKPFSQTADATTNLFSVCTTVPGTATNKTAFASASILAGRLPMASAINGDIASCSTATTSTSVCTVNSSSCTVVARVNIPGQNINNARSINFAGLYRNGACVPAPVCPGNNVMTPQIMVVPVSVSGFYSPSFSYPLTGFTAYATGESLSTPTPTSSQPLDCSADTPAPADCFSSYGTTATSTAITLSAPLTGNYWRVCVRINTSNGTISKANGSGYQWGETAAILLVMTRCMPNNEPTGSDFTVFTSP